MALSLSWPTTRSTVSGAVVAALCLVATLLAWPAAAQNVAPGGYTVAGIVDSSVYGQDGAPPTFATPGTAADVTTIELNASRTVLNFDRFNLTSEDTLNLVFTSSSHSVLLRINSGAADIGGTLNTFVGSAPGGTVVLSAPDGIVTSSSTRIDAGNLLATTARTADTDFFSGNSFFTEGANSIRLAEGADIDAQGLIGFVAPYVAQAATVGGAEALYGSAVDFSLVYDQTSGQLQSFTPVKGAAGGLVELAGDDNGGSVAVSTLSTSPGGGGVYIGGTVSPSSPPASGYGYTTLSAGGGLQRGSGGTSWDMRTVPRAGAPAQAINVPGTIEGYGKVRSYSSGATTVSGQVRNPTGHDVVLDAAGDLAIAESGAVSSTGLAVVSTAANFVNHSGADGVATGGTASAGQWIVYAGDRDGNTYGGLDSGNTALWGDTLATRAPGQVSGNRYVFAPEPTLTFTSRDHAKTYGVDATGSLNHRLTGLQPGEPGVFAADTADTAFSGAPELSSPGAPADAPAPVPVGDTYPIAIAQGTLISDAGYGFAFDSAGRLSVASLGTEDTAPVVAATVTGAKSANDWYTSDVGVSWSVTDPQSGVWSEDGCGDVEVTTDTTGQTITCTATSAGGTASESVTIKRDTVLPSLNPRVSPNPTSQNGSATASPNATDATSGIASASCDTVDTSSIGTYTVACTATDTAGHTNTATTSYTVSPNKLVGFFSPVDNNDVLNRAKAGQVIPLKWRFLDANDQPITSLTGVSVNVSALNCDGGPASDTIEQYAAGPSDLQNLGDGYYQLNWKSPKAYASTCKTINLDVRDDTAPLTALFRFVK